MMQGRIHHLLKVRLALKSYANKPIINSGTRRNIPPQTQRESRTQRKNAV
jgi:hypothetical protein